MPPGHRDEQPTLIRRHRRRQFDDRGRHPPSVPPVARPGEQVAGKILRLSGVSGIPYTVGAYDRRDERTGWAEHR
jgi:hypothetical protein